MKSQLAVIITAITISSLATFAFTTMGPSGDNSLKSAAAMLGHITLTAYDENGEIKQYVQTDNVIVNSGDDCIVEAILGASGGCANPSNAFTFVHLGTGASTMTEGSTLTEMTWNRQTAGSPNAITAASGASGASSTVSATFQDVSTTITEAALINSSGSAGDILAIQDFADIALGETDDLTVQWTITVDGS